MYKNAKEICVESARIAALNSNVPLPVLLAVALTESGRTTQGEHSPWPWTVNTEGRGEFYESKFEALEFTKLKIRQGISSIDIGCFQINYKWHGSNFESIDQMFDPLSNAQYAARFLEDLHEEFGDWVTATGAFHSRDETHSARYLEKLVPNLSKMMDGSRAEVEFVQQNPSKNSFPLLNGATKSQSAGSLFPNTSTSRNSFIPLNGSRG